MGCGRLSFIGMVKSVLLSSLGLMAVLHVLPGLAEDWDSEIFVQQLDELKGNDQQLKQRKVEDPQWADYLSEIEPAYDEKGFPEITTSDPNDNFFSQKLNWSLTGRGEVPYLAVVYQLIEGETEKDYGALSGVYSGRSCGGVLVSTERLITNCVCVATYFAVNVYPQAVTTREGKPGIPYDLGWKTPGRYLFNGKMNRIYIQFGSNRYYTGKNMPGVKDPKNDMHLVDGTEAPDPDLPTVSTDQECGDLAKVEWFHGDIPRDADTRTQNKFANTLAFVPFWPPIRHPAPGQFVPWPPVPFTDHLTQVRLSQNPSLSMEQVIVTGIGFSKSFVTGPNCPVWRLLDDEGQEIPLHKQSINLPYIHCTKRDDYTCRGTTRDDKYHKLSCFCDLYEPDKIGGFGCKVIGGGPPGWPIIYQGNVIALTASGRDNFLPGSPILGSSLAHERFQKHVEKVLTREKMWKQRTERPPMFREDLAADSYVFYDYPEQPNWFVHLGTTPKLIPLSLAEHVRPHLVTSAMMPFVSVYMYLARPISL